MKSANNKLIAIIGPTASGKSDMAIQLAKKFSGDVVSVDSRQVYKAMNIGSAKVEGQISKKNGFNIKIDGKLKKIYPYISENINHWMIDVADPFCETYTLAHFQDLAYQIIFKLFSKSILPILCGGSGLYMDAILKGYKIPKTSPKLRAELEKFTTSELLAELKKMDPISFTKVDKKNRRRILRVIESYLVNQSSHLNYKTKKPQFKYLIIGLNWPRDILYERIDNRIDERIGKGMIEEVKKLHRAGLSYQKLYDFGLEYRYCTLYLKGELSRGDMIQKLKFKSHDYVRRQLTWWRRNSEIIWLDAQHKNLYKNAQKLVKKFIR